MKLFFESVTDDQGIKDKLNDGWHVVEQGQYDARGKCLVRLEKECEFEWQGGSK